MQYYLSKFVDLPFDEAVLRTREALAGQGFGIPVEMDLRAIMQEKLGESLRPYLILGACMPRAALAAVQSEEQIGLLLPCNWVVQQHDDGRVEVSAVDPQALGGLTGNEALEPLMEDVRERIIAALDEIN